MRGTTTSGSGLVEAWTEQHPVVLERLHATGEFHADGRRVPQVVRPMFDWMRGEMVKRVGGARGRPLIWLTVAPLLSKRSLCDWRCTRRSGEPCSKVHITPGKDWLRVSIPAERLLLSHFGYWSERVMAANYVPLHAADDERWDRRLRRELTTPRDAPTPHPVAGSPRTRQAVVDSWQRIFELDPHADETVQATVEQLYLGDITDVLAAPDPADVPAPFNVNVSTYLRHD